MSVFCKLGAHSAAGPGVWNNGFYFGSCRRCGCDLVRGAHDRWRAVPRGFKVVWRQRPPGYPDWSRLANSDEAPARRLHRHARNEQAGLSSMLARG